jgi:hypothetical protein
VRSASAASPFSAVETLHPRRVSSRFMSIRVKLSSSTTNTGIPGNGGAGFSVAPAPPLAEPALGGTDVIANELVADGGVPGVDVLARRAMFEKKAADVRAGRAIGGGW